MGRIDGEVLTRLEAMQSGGEITGDFLDAASGTLEFEEARDHLYCDSVGAVTVGVGDNVDVPGKLEKVVMQKSDTVVTPAGPEEKKAARALVKKVYLDKKYGCETSYYELSTQGMSDDEIQKALRGVGCRIEQRKGGTVVMANLKPGSFEDVSSLRISPEEAAKRYVANLQASEGELRKVFPNYDEMPLSGKKALLDMHFNLGGRGFRKYSELIAAVRKGDWVAASEKCKRNGVPSERNDATKALFLEAKSQAYPPKRQAPGIAGERSGLRQPVRP
ncbi:MAG: hypothetical protein EDX89_24345 [Acidobacteria bacterium]|nr:MAG: hypothetical protein EDX89_24345 [Acidobacteriota bacterium]MCE7958691.1 hypothetical protein [Acidobacteria bacterium ACB2]